jgi:hypothetical protein
MRAGINRLAFFYEIIECSKRQDCRLHQAAILHRADGSHIFDENPIILSGKGRFKSTARRLGCDEDRVRFEAKLDKLAKSAGKSKMEGS